MTALALPLLRSSSRSRAPALLLVLGLHIGLGLLLTRSPLPALQLPQRPGSLQLIEVPAAPNAPSRSPLPVPLQPAPPRALPSVPLPEFRIVDAAAPSITVAPNTPSPPPLTAPAAPALPGAGTLDLRLPSASARPALPGAAALTEQLRHDPRANTPMASGAQRMAEAFGAKGWTVIDLGDGSHKAFGPHGECQIVRPSMVNGIPDHPHAGLLPNRVFACGGIEKGSLQHARPHERKNR